MSLDGTDLALLVAASLAIVALAVIAVFVGRRIVLRFLAIRMHRRVDRVRAIIAEASVGEGTEMDRLLFQLGEVQDRSAVRSALDELLESDRMGDRPLDQLYRSLGLIDEYIRDLRTARTWTKRAASARALGQLRVVEALPALIETLRDPQEDQRSVKTAVAEALSQIDAVEAVPLLLHELQTPDAWASPRIAEMLVDFGADAVPHLITALDDEAHTNGRVWASQILGRIGEPAAVGPLIARLRDRSEQVRMSVAEALGRLGDARAINDLVDLALRDPVPPVRAESARALGTLKDPSVVESLIALFNDPDYWTRLRAVEAIEMIGPTDSTALDAALRDPSPEVRGRAAMALQRIGFLSERVDDLESSDRATVDRAHHTLVEMGRAGLIESILYHAESPSLRVRSRIAGILGDVGDEHAVEALLILLKDPQWPVRVRAVEAISQIRPPDAVAKLIGGLADEEESVRASIVEAIRNIGVDANEETAQALIEIFDTDNAEVRRAVVETVGGVQTDVVDTLIERALLDPNDDVRHRAVLSIEHRPSEEWTVALIGQLGDPNTNVRSEVVRLLGIIGTPAALEGVTLNLHTEDYRFREALTKVLADQGVERVLELVGRPRGLETFLALVWALGKTRDTLAVPQLQDLSQHAEAKVRAAVAGALGKIEGADSQSTLLRLLSDRDERTRAAAANALANVGNEEAKSALVEALDDPDTFVRGCVAIALGRVGGDDVVTALENLAKSRDRSLAARAVVGLGLAGGREGFDAAIRGLSHRDLQGEIEKIVSRLGDGLRQRFRANLYLEDHPQVSLGGNVARRYTDALRISQDSSERLAAAQGLVAIGVSEHRAPLIDAVRTDPSYQVRAAALRGLAVLADETDVIRVFVDALRDPSSSVQMVAAEGLGSRATPDHNPDLLSCFRAEDDALSRAVIDALARANVGRVADLIDEIMGHDEPALLRGGAAVLGALGDPRALGVLRSWCRDEDVTLKAAAIEALGALGTAAARDAILECGSDPDERVRVAVVSGMSSLAGGDVEEVRRTMCRDPSVKVRQQIAIEIGRSAHLSSLEIAETLVSDPHDEVRHLALVSLLLLRDGTAVARFVALASAQDELVRARLRELGPGHPALASTEQVFLAERGAAERTAAFEALALIHGISDEVLERAITDPLSDVRKAALDACIVMDHDKLDDTVERLVRDPDPTVQAAARRRRLTPVETGS